MNCYEFNNNCNELNELQVYAMVCLCLCYELLYVCFFFFCMSSRVGDFNAAQECIRLMNSSLNIEWRIW